MTYVVSSSTRCNSGHDNQQPPRDNSFDQLEFAYRKFHHSVSHLFKIGLPADQTRLLKLLANAPTQLQFDPSRTVNAARYRAADLMFSTQRRGFEQLQAAQLFSPAGVLNLETTTAWWVVRLVFSDLFKRTATQLDLPAKIFGSQLSNESELPTLSRTQRQAFQAHPRSLNLDRESAQPELRTFLSNLQHLADYIVATLRIGNLTLIDRRSSPMRLGEGCLEANGSIGLIGTNDQHLYILTPLGMLPVCSLSNEDYFRALQILAPVFKLALRVPKATETFHAFEIDSLPSGPSLPTLTFAASKSSGNKNALGSLWNATRPTVRAAYQFGMDDLETAPRLLERQAFVNWPTLDTSFVAWNNYFIGMQRLCDYLVRGLRESAVTFSDDRAEPIQFFNLSANDNGGLGVLAYENGRLLFMTALGLLPFVSVSPSDSEIVMNLLKRNLGLHVHDLGWKQVRWPVHGDAVLYHASQLPGGVPLPEFGLRSLRYGDFERAFSELWARYAPSERRKTA